MLDTMKEKGTKEMNEEQVQYAKFEQFCKNTLAEKEKSITTASDKIETLEADIEQAVAEAERLGKEVTAHSADIEKATAEKDEATALRAKERADFATALADYTESIDAVGRALKVLKEAREKSSFVQLSAVRQLKMVPKDTAASIDAFLETEKAAPEPKTYEFQSGGVIGMMESLQDKFVDERVSLEKGEQEKKHSFAMLVQSLEAQLAQSKKDMDSKSQFQAKRRQDKASSEGELAETSQEKASDSKYSSDLQATCRQKAAAFDERQKLRKEEIEAIGKAQDIIASNVAGKAEQHLPSLLQRASLAFLRSEGGLSASAAGAPEVARFLQQRASQLNSRVLSAAAMRAGADPMEKVKAMIGQLIIKMQEQANEEATKQGWCDAELSTNKATREEKADASEALQSEMDELSAAITKLGEEVVTLNKEVTELNSAMSSATELRQKEKQKNAATVRDAKEAQAAVAQALMVLKEFYAKAGEATSFVQSSGGQPETFDAPYKGMGGESGGVVSMLEVIESDFARLQAETEASEEAAKTEFDEFMEDSKVDKATKTKTAEHKAGKKQAKTQELTTLEGDLQGTAKELDAAKAYYEKLKPDCVDTGASYAQRKVQREQELKDLETALKMLS
ncbi:unnamed protein product [Effrenium voratum]|uniref:Uncharacterized protein n=1 Tax=Effrenium voratum TaxID=2562239 RepID=A0AA36JHH1_9DINO|nr:unnamed protein product [Effrenium voratum]